MTSSFQKFEENLLRKETHLREALAIGQEIVTRCHPDSLSSLKQWLSVLRARWEEVSHFICISRFSMIILKERNIYIHFSLMLLDLMVFDF